ncbi:MULTISPECIES: cell division protein ZapB [unclassified Agarivorans]|uniref:cell division protein ZapB n=2 Tax=unclassified Agarivorans TaxID=2636026 RepID=UPI003014FE67
MMTDSTQIRRVGLETELTGEISMSFDVLEKLEAKVQVAVDSIELLRMEIDELKEQNSQLNDENGRLLQEQQAWQERLKALLGRIEDVHAE